MEELRRLLAEDRKLVVKFGADVTAPFLHIGHAVNLWMMRELQERGHKVVFLIGDFTARIGDPSGRTEGRQVPAAAEREANAGEFIRQVGRVLKVDDRDVFEVRRNSEWFGAMGAGRLLELMSAVTHARLVSRDAFKARLARGDDVFSHELVYPILQGWDSVELRSDLTIVGSDQLFNEMMGRFFQEREGQRPQVVLTTRITPGLDGVRKQSKTLGNFVAIDDGPRDMFGKAMSLPDGLIVDWMEVYTTLMAREVAAWRDALFSGANPRDAKAALAEALVARWHGRAAAAGEREWFERSFGYREFPPDAPVVTLPEGARAEDAVKSCLGCSSSEARRLVAQGGASVGERKLSPGEALRGEDRELRVGKRGFFRIARGPTQGV
jgi:tyrosyl-tRNA synthetase